MSAASRAVPFHCPFCAETDLWPREEGGWECRACVRSFRVELIGIGDAAARIADDAAATATGVDAR